MALGAHGQVTVAVLWSTARSSTFPWCRLYKAFPSAINNSEVVGQATRWLGAPPVEESVGSCVQRSVVVLDGMARPVTSTTTANVGCPRMARVHVEAEIRDCRSRIPMRRAALAINNRGQAVDIAKNSTGGPHSTTARHPLDGGPPSSAAVPRCARQSRYAVRRHQRARQVVGFVDEFVELAAIWKTARATQLPFPGGSTGRVRALGINNRGESSGPRSTMGPSSASSGHGRRTRREKPVVAR